MSSGPEYTDERVGRELKEGPGLPEQSLAGVAGFEGTAKEEIIVDPKTGRIRQAGTSGEAADAIRNFRTTAERKLFFFAKYVMGMTLLSEKLHLPIANWLGAGTPKRRLVLLPRDHLKTSLATRSLTPHILIQPKEANIYFPGCQEKVCRHARSEEREDGSYEVVRVCAEPSHRFDGARTRVLLAQSVLNLAESQLQWIEGQWESNGMLRMLWPGRCWLNGTPRRRWNKSEMVIPREVDFPEASIMTIGVDGSIAGRHFDVHNHDDVCAEKAADSEIEMAKAIQWFKDSRALMDDQEWSLEFVTGTHWSVYDLYHTLMYDFDGKGNGDPTISWHVRSILEDGKPIFPEMGFSLKTIERLRAPNPARFSLMYMNDLSSPDLVDFNTESLRQYVLEGDALTFATDERDAELGQRFGGEPSLPTEKPTTMEQVLRVAKAGGRDEYFATLHGEVKNG